MGILVEILNLNLTIMVVLGSIPLWVSLFQFSIVGLHAKNNHYTKSSAITPNVSAMVPAWNEVNVLNNTIESLMSMDYPKENLRIYIIDDASTDSTPELMKTKMLKYPKNVFHLRRENGGQGKAHTLNHGIRLTLKEEWSDAFLIMDADVLFESKTLLKMTRHFSDPSVGAVTAYIKEGSQPGRMLNRFIGFEYITAQAASRRAQNVLGFMACLAGGAQLHTRQNMLQIGGSIDTSSLAEDTFTTFKTQLAGNKAIFDGNAIVWAEEPDSIVGLWKQRLRWARGNLQITRHYKSLWGNKKIHHKLGGYTFMSIWFGILLMPIFMILAATGLVSLYFSDFPLSWVLFRAFWILNVIVYLFVTVFSLLIDSDSGRVTWKEGIVFPGFVSISIIILSFIPGCLDYLVKDALVSGSADSLTPQVQSVVLFMYAWLATSMLGAYAAYSFEKTKGLKWASRPLLLIAGYGPLLCAITFYSYIAEIQNKEMKWDKTEKTGKAVVPG